MMIPTPHGPDSMKFAAVAAMATYLSVSEITRSSGAIRSELIELLDEGTITTKLAEAALSSADPEIFAYLLSRGVNLAKVMNPRGSMSLAWGTIMLDHIDIARRMKLFEIIAAQDACHNATIEVSLAKYAIANRNLEFLDAITDWAQHHSKTALILMAHGSGATTSCKGHPDFLKALLARLDFDDPAMPAMFDKAIEQSFLRGVALFLALGLDVSAAMERWTSAGKPSVTSHPAWMTRFLHLASSAHGRLAIMSRKPALQDVFEMPQALLEVKLAGLSNRQARAIRRKQKARKMPLSLRLLQQAAGQAA